jgi:hypothetical protein
MAHDQYTNEINCLSPVAIKLGQTKVCAPGHDTWCEVTCEACNERFKIGPNRTYGSRRSPEYCVRSLQKILGGDHKNGIPHSNWYELPD